MVRVKNSNCLNFCTQVDPCKTRKAVYFFSSNLFFFFSRKTNFSLSPSRIDGSGHIREGNLTNVCSLIDSSSSVKCKLCRSWLLRGFWPCEKAMCSLPLQKSVGEENLFFTMCHHSEFDQITYVNYQRNDLQNDLKFSLGKCFLAT